jgi:uncharacterized protein DUF4386
MYPTSTTARTAGGIYVALTILGIFSLLYLPGLLIVHNDATATANSITNHDRLFRIYIATGVISDLVFAALGFALYRVLGGVDKSLAWLMVILVLISSTLGLVSEMNPMAALILVRGDALSALDVAQRNALAMLFLKIDNQFTLVNEVFWGLWLLPFGMLVARSGFLPRVLGWWLLVNGVAYLALSFTSMLAPQFQDIVSKITFPALLGEIAIALWLTVMGVRPKSQYAPAAQIA